MAPVYPLDFTWPYLVFSLLSGTVAHRWDHSDPVYLVNVDFTKKLTKIVIQFPAELYDRMPIIDHRSIIKKFPGAAIKFQEISSVSKIFIVVDKIPWTLDL